MYRHYLFPIAFMTNTLAMTALLICLGLFGYPLLAADVGVVQGLTLALFYSFSANGRSLILNNEAPVSARSLFLYRFVLIIPFASIAFWLARYSGVDSCLTLILLLRRSIEWLDEIFLSEMERTDNKLVAVRYVTLQTLLLAFAVLWMFTDLPYPLSGIFLWAIMPLILSGRFFAQFENFKTWIPKYTFVRMVPHIGSTAIIGITVYVFRLLLINIVGKEIAGDLFVAFAIGGVLGSIVANAFGPSVILAQTKQNIRTLPKGLKILMSGFFVIGLLITLTSNYIDFLAKTSLFWLAIGFSMLAAVPMVLAQIIRYRLLQHHVDKDLFGSDVLINVLLVTFTPFMFYIFGLQAMAGLYLLSSLLAWLFYKCCECYENGSLTKLEVKFPQIKHFFASLLILPIFFQLGTGVFSETTLVFDANHDPLRLPIPISLLAIFLILISISNFERARVTFIFIFFSFVLMLIASILSTSLDTAQQQYKFFLLAQFILPMFALISGQLFENEDETSEHTLEKCLFYILLFMLPLQMISSWLQGSWLLMPSVYIFSVYQHLHYVPIMFVTIYMFIISKIWQITSMTVFLFLTFLMAIYVFMTSSLYIITTFFLGLLLHSIYTVEFCKLKKNKYSYFVLAILFGFTYWKLAGTSLVNELLNSPNHGNFGSVEEKAIQALQQKITIWYRFLVVAMHDPKVILIGFSDFWDSSQFRVSSNYYLSLLTGFGLIGGLPLLALIGFTIKLMYSQRDAIKNESFLLFPCVTLLFLLLIENFFYVGLRQLYSATLTYFLWGIVLNRLLNVNLTAIAEAK